MSRKTSHLTIVVSARLPVAVAAEWRAAAARSGMLMSDWLRHTVEAGAVQVVDYRRPQPRRRYSAADPSLLHAVARIGNNVNQCAKFMHQQSLSAQRIDALRCLHVLLDIQRDLSSVAQVRVRVKD